ncbi:hypothetical protein M405DRAFT_867888 [Rhizopogon salebrosus TDB-379]|nr:hypothetical protein M405DRAFT_867888 [Rhizopogon salebrosus TDB-379]
MSSDPPQTDLWLERSRLAGMILAAVSYGGLFILTVQAASALMQRPRHGGKIAEHRYWLLFYVFSTFVLGTVGFAGNAKYTEMIWIDLRDAKGGPTALINDELNYRINVLVVICYYIMEWFMQVLLLHRCFVIWNWERYVMVPMISLFIAMIAMSILVLIQASTGVIWYNINTVLIYYSLQVGISVLYTILVTNRLLVMRGQIKQILGEYSGIYNTIVLMIIESTMLYTPLAILFILTFAFHSYISNLCFLGISHVQGIAQLLIIVRVARGRSIAHQWSSGHAAAPSSIAFSGTTHTEGINLQSIAGPERTVQLLSEKAEVV